MSDTPLPITPVTAAVTPEPLSEDVTLPRAAALARDIALDMFELPILLKKHSIPPGQYETLRGMPYFRQLVEQLTKEWNEPKNQHQRLALQAGAGLEDVLPDIIARAKIKNEPLAGIAQLVKVIADISGTTSNRPQQTAPGEKFNITINLGADTETYSKTKPAITIEQAPEPAQNAGPEPSVQSLSEGFSALLALRTEPEQT